MQEVITKANTLSAYGLISRNLVTAELTHNENQGIRFIHPCGSLVAANTDNLFSTQRNTVLATDSNCICLTEHFLAAAAFAQINNVDVKLDEEELPFGDGGAFFWFDFFEKNMPEAKENLEAINFTENIRVEDENDDSRYIELSPAENLELSYTLVTDKKALGTQSFIWQEGMAAAEILKARTFSSYQENQMLQLENWVLGFDDEGFKQDLLFDNEPARHKALDLVGDLYLSGYNPLGFKAKIKSHKAGHELNTKLAAKIRAYLKANGEA